MEEQVKDPLQTRPPAGGGADHLPGPLQHGGPLAAQHLDGQGLLAGEEGVEEGLGDAQGLVHLLQGGRPVPVPGEQLLPPVQELFPQALPVQGRIGLFCHGGTSVTGIVKDSIADFFTKREGGTGQMEAKCKKTGNNGRKP